ncbi:Protein ATP11, mitochondrial [Candida viswanathii]|uniref:Protein ATP11, mitochondrial n=1 Tax=Candida viswanathii TaxID=5486 RepID=A0A367YHB9_9ASCO|nr:Protein ATP11, mitochondrial [Candida viswanathii]
MLSRTVLRRTRPLVSLARSTQFTRLNSSKPDPAEKVFKEYEKPLEEKEKQDHVDTLQGLKNKFSDKIQETKVKLGDPNVTEGMEKLAGREVFEKYSMKLQEKAKELGIPVEDLKQRFKDEIERVRTKLGGADPTEELQALLKKQEEERKKDGTIKIRGMRDPNAPEVPYKVLDDFIDVEKARHLPREDIIKIWNARFANNDRALHAVLTHLQFADLYTSAFKYPLFILPVPKPLQDGYELQYVQWQFVGPETINCMFTTLAEYKLHGEYASPHTTLTFHLELADDKDLVLMNGYVDKESGITMEEAHLLVVNLQRFYSGKYPEKTKLLKEFNAGDENFNIDELIQQATTV